MKGERYKPCLSRFHLGKSFLSWPQLCCFVLVSYIKTKSKAFKRAYNMTKCKKRQRHEEGV